MTTAAGGSTKYSSKTAPGELATVLRASAGRLSPGLDGGKVYTDDRAPVEWLVDLSLADVATGKGR